MRVLSCVCAVVTGPMYSAIQLASCKTTVHTEDAFSDIVTSDLNLGLEIVRAAHFAGRLRQMLSYVRNFPPLCSCKCTTLATQQTVFWVYILASQAMYTCWQALQSENEAVYMLCVGRTSESTAARTCEILQLNFCKEHCNQ